MCRQYGHYAIVGRPAKFSTEVFTSFCAQRFVDRVASVAVVCTVLDYEAGGERVRKRQVHDADGIPGPIVSARHVHGPLEFVGWVVRIYTDCTARGVASIESSLRPAQHLKAPDINERTG